MKTRLMLRGVTLTFFLLIAFSGFAEAQEDEKKEKPEAKPIELPNFDIVRVEELSIDIGKKQEARGPLPLNADYLDSLNSFEKQTVIPVAPEKFQTQVFDNSYKHGFVRGDFGRFLSADLEAGYGMNIKGYELYGNAGLNITEGHVDDAARTAGFFKLTTDYIAPMKYFIFGGSRTRTAFSLSNDSYRLYGSDNIDFIENGSFERNALDIDLSLTSDGNYEGIRFRCGTGVKTLQVLNSDKNGSENTFRGFVGVGKYWHNFFLGGDLDLDFAGVNSDAAAFLQADASAQYMNEKLSLKATGGFQYGGTTLKDDRGGFLIAGDIEYRINDMVSLFGNVRSGLRHKKYSDYFAENPYLNLQSEIDYTYDIADINIGVVWHPTIRTGVSGKIGYETSKRLAFFTDNIDEAGDIDGTFNIAYADAAGPSVEIDGWFYLTEKDKLTGNMTGSFATLENGNYVPYIPIFKSSIDYERKLLEKLDGGIGMVFASGRYGDIENLSELDAYFDLRINAEYRMSRNLKFYFNGENLLNQNIYLQNNYKLRGIFIKGGILWQF